MTLSAFRGGSLLGFITGFQVSELQHFTQQDRFYGWVDLNGIDKIVIAAATNNDWAMDHLQYGAVAPAAVPEPSSPALLTTGIVSGMVLLLIRQRRRGRAEQRSGAAPADGSFLACECRTWRGGSLQAFGGGRIPIMNRCRFLLTVTLCAVAGGGVAVVTVAGQPIRKHELREQLATALVEEDTVAIRRIVAEVNRFLGEKAGVPETPDTYLPIPRAGKWLTTDEAAAGFEPAFEQLEQLRWWKIGMDPTQLGHTLREPAAVASGNLAVCRAKLEGAERSLAFAKEAADFLLWAQESGGAGVFPFPASRGVSQSPPFLASEKYLKQAEIDGRLDSIVKNGWVVNDDGNGGLQFDNGECGIALLEFYEFTKDKKYLDAATRAADWTLTRPLVPNWNYNSFSAYLLARTYRVTGDKKYLEAATKKAVLGVIPGQLKEGPHAGRWCDAHNARPGYHYIMLRSLAELVTVLPKDDAARPGVFEALRLGLKTRNKDFLAQGASNKDKAMEALLIVNRAFADDKEFLEETSSADALDALAKLVSEQARRGSPPLGPREWGHFLEYIESKSER
jgi:hypothetical protein